MKRAVTAAPRRIEFQDTDAPRPGPGEILVRAERVGICGSDLHIFFGHHPRATYPRVQGHEASARVESIGSGCSGSWRTGQRVAIDPLIPCGSCYPCRVGRPNSCTAGRIIGAQTDGLLQQYVVIPERNLYDASTLSAVQAALCEPVSVAVQAAHRAGIQKDEQVLVIGAGPIGLSIALVALDRGARVMIVDRIAARLELARSFGVDAAIAAGHRNLMDEIRTWTSGDGPAVAIDAVGNPAVIRQCCQLVAPAGRVVVVGLSSGDVCLPVVDFTYKEMTILGSRAGAGRFEESIALVARLAGRATSMVSHTFPLSDLESAFDLAAGHPEAALKVMIDLDHEGG